VVQCLFRDSKHRRLLKRNRLDPTQIRDSEVIKESGLVIARPMEIQITDSSISISGIDYRIKDDNFVYAAF
jgi:hypothetical protein